MALTLDIGVSLRVRGRGSAAQAGSRGGDALRRDSAPAAHEQGNGGGAQAPAAAKVACGRLPGVPWRAGARACYLLPAAGARADSA